jgi:cysteinyl-tRNA synthetase
MALELYNTMSRRREAFAPLMAGRAGVYACGPTVYQRPHIGNYRTFLFSDLLRRYLRWKGLDVRFVMNLTDVDDRTIDGAAAAGIELDALTQPLVDAFHAEMRSLGVEPADVHPRATRYIRPMVDLVERLLARGHAYQSEDGSVYFDVSSFPEYGRLARLDPEGIRTGAGLEDRRGANEDYAKDDPRDFALWKPAREADRRVGAVWPAPWGEGRPGWHLECSAMSMAELGETFDIHVGGEDLIFPHHEDEIAQSEGATGQPFVRYWLHVKHLLVDGEKMSKSLGNVYTLADLAGRGYGPAQIRYLLLSAHYRKELNFTFGGLDDAGSALRRVVDFRDRLRAPGPAPVAGEDRLAAAAARALAAFAAGLDDDLNVPAGLAALFTLVREGNAALDVGGASAAGRQAALAALAGIDEVLGVVELAGAARGAVDGELAGWVAERLAAREEARGERDFARADAIRGELAAAGIVVEDTAQGPRWKRQGGGGEGAPAA